MVISYPFRGDVCFQKCADVPQSCSPLQATGVLLAILTGGSQTVNDSRQPDFCLNDRTYSDNPPYILPKLAQNWI
ncbi:hypothetical protein PXH59_02125 [Xenorhabdus sp. SF857]|uniref:hypothetical protein n=1 Tax=Xenorhabdus bakwenae TaxID=3026967 RepID=UPI002557EE80|nr:hypothetical protein [Xenorhabdus sp. SF857]WFQ80010.1 hypothetical protein PXH59_02125 [Xenorhabdus sp. SF857]